MEEHFNNLQENQPFGEFPYKYTKKGQEEYLKHLNEPKVSTQSTNTNDKQNEQHEEHTKKSNLDISKLLPLFTNMQNGGSQSDMVNMLLPLLGGGGEYKDILNMLSNQNKNQKSSSVKPKIQSSIDIDSYKKV